MTIQDIGPKPDVFDLETAPRENPEYRRVAWSGRFLQLTLMSIGAGQSIGLEMHPDTDQFLRVDAGRGRLQTGPAKETMTAHQDVGDGWCMLVPAGTWHDVVNTGDTPLRLYAIYAPVHHAAGRVHATAEDAMRDEQAGGDEPPAWSEQPPRVKPDQHAG